MLQNGTLQNGTVTEQDVKKQYTDITYSISHSSAELHVTLFSKTVHFTNEH